MLSQPDVADLLGLRDRAILEVFYSTGIRRAELVALSMYDVDFERGTVLVRAGKGNFGDGNGSSLQNPTHGFAAAGTYAVVLTVTDDGGAQHNISRDVTVTAPSSIWVTLTSDDFESNWGPYSDGGSDCRRSSNDAAFAHGGTYCARIRDNSGSVSAFASTNPTDWSTYSELEIDFWFIGNGMENGEDFLVEFWDGSAWQVVASYVAGTDFSNGVFINDTVTISGFDFSSARVRFRCDASANNDRIYIDDVVVSGR